MVFKKDLTPIGKKGSVIKHSGKGSAVRQPDVMAQVTGRYPKPAPVAVAPVAVAPVAAPVATAPPVRPVMGPPIRE